eukprot:532080-Hanusia_phi.AAC.2
MCLILSRREARQVHGQARGPELGMERPAGFELESVESQLGEDDEDVGGGGGGSAAGGSSARVAAVAGQAVREREEQGGVEG